MCGCRIIGAIGIFTPGFSGGGFPGLVVSVEPGSIPGPANDAPPRVGARK